MKGVRHNCIEKCKKFSACDKILMALRAIFFAILNIYVNSNPGYGYLVRNKGENFLDFCAATNMSEGNTLFKKRTNRLITSEFGQSKGVFERYESEE